LFGRRAPARGQPARSARRRFPEPQEQGGCLIMADTDTVSSLADLKNLTAAAPAAEAPAGAPAAEAPVQPAAPSAPLRAQEIDAQGRAYATGRRKDAVARVW